MLNSGIWRLVAPLLLVTAGAYAADEQPALWVEIHAVDQDGTKEAIGRIGVREVGNSGLEFRPELQGLAPGIHGFHIHENPDCAPAVVDGETTPAGAAGDHLAPSGNDHAAPWKEGHLGDLPALYVTGEGVADHPVFKPGITLDDIRDHALVIHEGGDTYTDEPDPSGGGGTPAACGIATGS